jgi:hypothetical protein
VLEGARVLKRTGKFVIYPSIGRVDYLQPFLRADGYKLENQIVSEDIPEEEVRVAGSLAKRSVITRV